MRWVCEDKPFNALQVCLDDEFGCELNCSTMTDHTQEHKFVIAMTQVSCQLPSTQSLAGWRWSGMCPRSQCDVQSIHDYRHFTSTLQRQRPSFWYLKVSNACYIRIYCSHPLCYTYAHLDFVSTMSIYPFYPKGPST